MMKFSPTEHIEPPTADPAPLKRRGMLLGTGVAVAAGAVAAVASRGLQVAAPEPVASAGRDDGAEGYRLSQHVLRYYETTRI